MSSRMDTYRRLVDKEPHLQAGKGMMRNGELELIARVCKDYEIDHYVEFGCGPCFSLQEIRKVCGDVISLYGFEIAEIPSYVYESISAKIYQMGILNSSSPPILNEKTIEICKQINNERGTTLWLTDNGYKVGELKSIVDLLYPGDMIATHDYTTEVIDEYVPFLYDGRFRVVDELEKEIEEHGYLLRFWERKSTK